MRGYFCCTFTIETINWLQIPKGQITAQIWSTFLWKCPFCPEVKSSFAYHYCHKWLCDCLTALAGWDKLYPKSASPIEKTEIFCLYLSKQSVRYMTHCIMGSQDSAIAHTLISSTAICFKTIKKGGDPRFTVNGNPFWMLLQEVNWPTLIDNSDHASDVSPAVWWPLSWSWTDRHH